MNTSSKRKMGTERDEAPRPMLTIREASRLLSVHSNTLRRWAAKGFIKEYRIGPGGHRRFKAEDVAALILEQPRYHQVEAGRLIRH
jgi:excisionase family DNA binding protein